MKKRQVGGVALFALVAGGAFVSSQARASDAQSDEIPGCAAAVCEDITVLTVSLDTLLKHTPTCGARPPAVLLTMYLAPHTSFGDFIAGRTPAHEGLPTSPPVMRLDDLDGAPFRRYRNDVQVLDTTAVMSGRVLPDQCLYVFSPVTWMGTTTARVIVSEYRDSPRLRAQRFVFAKKHDDRWVASRVETGVQE